jgi:hypothetical protein
VERLESKIVSNSYTADNRLIADPTHSLRLDNLQFIVAEFKKFGSEQEFWARYSSPNSTQLSFQQIKERLKNERKQKDDEDVAKAKMEFGEDAVLKWGYRRGAEMITLKTNRGLALRYRQLKGQAAEPEDGEEE